MVEFTREFPIQSHLVDCTKRLKAVSFMLMTQEMALFGADQLGFGYDSMDVHHTTWVLSRMRMCFDKLPVWRDNVDITTWHKGLSGPFFLRDFEMKDKEGNMLATATTSWVVIDTVDRNFVKPERMQELVPSNEDELRHAIETPAPKVPAARGVEPFAERVHEVHYSDVDIVGHANNTKYVEWAFDMLDPQVLVNGTVSEVVVNFNHEALLGDKVLLRAFEKPAESGRLFIVEGSCEGTQVFATKIVLA